MVTDEQVQIFSLTFSRWRSVTLASSETFDAATDRRRANPSQPAVAIVPLGNESKQHRDQAYRIIIPASRMQRRERH